ncbi:glycosyltransferase family 4 protein [uncultured Methanoculleus sp.]|jgi:glycosyltransferase involved in cell wall biosynthesis|uniref:Glycosyltransferase family 4 protein n=1 Tax=Methanoculleus palmolei TaxID=72612 RepID=A0ABD8AAX8_9EURY|nr:glycosyltransferase family 4 protein [Methanoculleus palmolei]
MKITMLVLRFYPQIGGVEKHVLRLSEELIKKGHDVAVVTTNPSLTAPDTENLRGISIYRIPDSRPLKIWAWFVKNRQILSQADVIHCHDYPSFILWYLPFRFAYPKKPVYVTFHGYEGIVPIPRRILFLRTLTERMTLGNICIGDYIPKWYGTRSTIILYGGVDLPEGATEGANAADICRLDKGVFVGRLEKDTGIIEYLQALKILKHKYGLSPEGYICGDGTLRDVVQKELADHNINFKMLGFVRTPEDYLRMSRFAFVSGYLGMLEAMAYRKLVFNVAIDPLRDDYLGLVPNAENIMVTAKSPEELAEKFFYLSNNPLEAERRLKEAYAFAAKRSWASVADAYLAVWQTLKH